MKIKEILEYGRINLIKKEDSYKLSKSLLKHLLNVNDTYILINSEKEIDEIIESKFKNSIKLLNNGIPMQYITNHQEFMKLDFYVDSNVLIPQPDTEILVEEIINICNAQLKDTKEINILDLCTGSGAIGVSAAKYIENAKVTMCDISESALEIANKNALANKVIDKCSFVLSDMFESIQGKFDIIVSNPPYIQTDVITKLDKEVQNEPIIALDGGKDGLNFYKIIVKIAHNYLNKNGILALEIGYDQKESVTKLLELEGKYTNIYSRKDLSGNDRIVVCNKK